MAPRSGLTRARIVDAAAELADRDGVDGLSLGAVAKRVGVKTPSLYNHLSGARGLRRELRLRGLQELAAALQRAAMGRAGRDALHAIALAYRDYARARPGLYGLTLQTVEDADDDVHATARDLVEVIVAALRGYGIAGDDALHATRALRAALHGFVALENGDAFGMDLATDESFERLVALLDRGLAARPR